jgi:hypothetical protein
MNNELDFFDKPQNVTWLLRIFYALCVLLFLLDFVIHRHIYHQIERVWGFYPIYGFIGCVVLVIVAKWMRIFLMRADDYYTRPEAEGYLNGRAEGEHHLPQEEEYLAADHAEDHRLSPTISGEGKHHVDD